MSHSWYYYVLLANVSVSLIQQIQNYILKIALPMCDLSLISGIYYFVDLS